MYLRAESRKISSTNSSPYRSLLFLYCRQLEQEPGRGITRAQIIATSSHSSARPDEITRSLETWTVNAAINYRARGDRAEHRCTNTQLQSSVCPSPSTFSSSFSSPLPNYTASLVTRPTRSKLFLPRPRMNLINSNAADNSAFKDFELVWKLDS